MGQRKTPRTNSRGNKALEGYHKATGSSQAKVIHIMFASSDCNITKALICSSQSHLCRRFDHRTTEKWQESEGLYHQDDDRSKAVHLPALQENETVRTDQVAKETHAFPERIRRRSYITN